MFSEIIRSDSATSFILGVKHSNDKNCSNSST